MVKIWSSKMKNRFYIFLNNCHYIRNSSNNHRFSLDISVKSLVVIVGTKLKYHPSSLSTFFIYSQGYIAGIAVILIKFTFLCFRWLIFDILEPKFEQNKNNFQDKLFYSTHRPL